MAIGSHESKRHSGAAGFGDLRQQVATTSLTERLPHLLDELRKVGFSIGVDQHIAVHELLIGLAAREAFPLQDPAVLGRLICPLVAKSPLEQELFAACYESWLGQSLETGAKVGDDRCIPLSTEHIGCGSQALKNADALGYRLGDRRGVSVGLFRWNRYLGWLIGLLAAVGSLVAALWAIKGESALGPGTGQPGPVDVLVRPLISIVTCTIPLLLLLAIALRGWLHVHLQRRVARELPDTTAIHLQFPKSRLFTSNAMAKISYDLRRSRLVSQERLDLEASVQASIRAGGVFIPVLSRRRVVPDYVALIDRRTFADQSTALTETLLARMAGDGVAVSTYYFDRSARFCFPKAMRMAGASRSVPIEDLAARHSDSRLLVFGDLIHILQSGSDHPQTWIQQLERWESPALFVRRSDQTSQVTHELLRALGFSIFSATESGLRAYADFVNGHSGQQAPNQVIAVKHQPTKDLLENEPVWIRNQPPGRSRVDSMLVSARKTLGETGFLCLSACAIYPEIKWELTAYLIEEICRTGTVRESPEELLARLTILPWFRHARMPDWLRVRLITDLESRQEKAIRGLIENLFLSALDRNAGSSSTFRIARDDSLIRWKVLRALSRRAWSSEADANGLPSAFREHIFATFIGDRLSFRLPRAAHRLVYGSDVASICATIRMVRWILSGGSHGGQARIPRVMGVACVITYIAAMFAPAVGDQENPWYQGWYAAWTAGLGSFGAPQSARIMAYVGSLSGTLANLLFLFAAGTFVGRTFLNRLWPGRLAISWISGVSVLSALTSTICFVFALLDRSFPVVLYVGVYLWILSPSLLFIANLLSPQRTKRRGSSAEQSTTGAAKNGSGVRR
jgi:hypothetical protein